MLHIEASNYKFAPNNIHVRAGDVIVVEVENVSDTEHTFTITGLRSQVIRSVPLPPRETVALKGRAFEPGEYWFHCDMPFHDYRDMEGRFLVEER